MITKFLLCTALATLFLAARANAAMQMKCDDASMMKMQTEMDAMSDSAVKSNKDMAMKHKGMAKTSMKDSKSNECMTHMSEAMDAMNKKM